MLDNSVPSWAVSKPGRAVSKPSCSFMFLSFPFLSPLRPPAGRLRRRSFFFLFGNTVKKTPGKAMFAQRYCVERVDAC